MKKITFVLLALFFNAYLSNVFAQSFIETNYKSHLQKENITRVMVSEKMFAMANTFVKNSNDPDATKVQNIISKIKSFDLLRMKDGIDANQEFAKGMSSLNKKYEELIRVKHEKNNVALMIDEDNDIIHEMVGLIAADSEFVVFNLVGEINLNEVSEIIQKFDEKGLKGLKGIGDLHSKTEIEVYPNPAKINSKISFKAQDDMVGGTISINDINGKLIHTQKIQNTNEDLPTHNLGAGTYIVKYEKDGYTINKKVLITE
jgi:hypothetical protein